MPHSATWSQTTGGQRCFFLLCFLLDVFIPLWIRRFGHVLL
jgi:hypothetical protein